MSVTACTIKMGPDISTAQVQDESYVTAPMLAFTPIFSNAREEELHTSFENAISDRLSVVQQRLHRLSYPELQVAPHTRNPVTDSLPATQKIQWYGQITGLWRRTLVSICLGLILLLSGFNLMGLLILLSR